VVASAVFGCGAVWRLTLAIRHYRIALAITDDPSAQELEQVSALLELGLGFALLAHAVAAACLVRRPLRLHGVVILAIAAVTGVLIAGSLMQAPVLSAPGLLPASLILGCMGAGYFSGAPWASAYLGALTGSVIGFCVGSPSIEPLAAAAVTVPSVVLALVGVALGRLVRRLSSFRRAA
jgi:hypothetical protein